tara:strand:- start:17 stop:481 length:465 start_codon:yes stop_codon:yes gene_type:complete
MIIERHRLTGSWPVKSRVQKVTKIEPTKNGADMDGQDRMMGISPDLYDTVMAYCQSCGNRMDIPIVHDTATNNQFQLISIPKEIAHKLENYKIECINCGSTNIIERQNHVNRYEVFTIKLDCSDSATILDKSSGTDDWYEGSTSSSGDGHPRKF